MDLYKWALLWKHMCVPYVFVTPSDHNDQVDPVHVGHHRAQMSASWAPESSASRILNLILILVRRPLFAP